MEKETKICSCVETTWYNLMKENDKQQIFYLHTQFYFPSGENDIEEIYNIA